MEDYKRPYVIINSAITLDAKLATPIRDSRISCKEDLVVLHRLRAEMKAVMVGINTLLIDNPSLSVKHVEGEVEWKIVIDTHARTPPEAKVFKTGGKVVVVCGVDADGERIEKLRNAGAVVIKAETTGQRVNLREALGKLREIGVEKVLVEGGGRINWSLIREGLVDRIRLAVLLAFLGSQDAVNVVEGPAMRYISEAKKMELVNIEKCSCGEMLFLDLIPRRD
ncbi:MAG TPA: hypothetical protein EYP20_01545 [Aigarchaeota archaeon]|nr:hypothetical protein [Aigarchaeota archaeon]